MSNFAHRILIELKNVTYIWAIHRRALNRPVHTVV